MKPTCSALLFAGLAALTFACANPSETGHAHQAEAKSPAAAETALEPESHAGQPAALSLNNGEPWEANPETTAGIVNMGDLTGRFVERTDPQAYKNLQAGLQKEFKEIVANCTMKGEAHNQLHHYIMPLQGHIEGLSAENLPDAEASLDELKAHLAIYPEYFKTE